MYILMLKRSIEEVSISESAGYTSKSSTYILNSRRNAEDIVREFYKKATFDLHILELSADDLPDSLPGGNQLSDLLSTDRYGFTMSEWAQIREDFLALISPLECKLSEPYMQALNFLCQVL